MVSQLQDINKTILVMSSSNLFKGWTSTGQTALLFRSAKQWTLPKGLWFTWTHEQSRGLSQIHSPLLHSRMRNVQWFCFIVNIWLWPHSWLKPPHFVLFSFVLWQHLRRISAGIRVENQPWLTDKLIPKEHMLVLRISRRLPTLVITVKLTKGCVCIHWNAIFYLMWIISWRLRKLVFQCWPLIQWWKRVSVVLFLREVKSKFEATLLAKEMN